MVTLKIPNRSPAQPGMMRPIILCCRLAFSFRISPKRSEGRTNVVEQNITRRLLARDEAMPASIASIGMKLSGKSIPRKKKKHPTAIRRTGFSFSGRKRHNTWNFTGLCTSLDLIVMIDMERRNRYMNEAARIVHGKPILSKRGGIAALVTVLSEIPSKRDEYHTYVPTIPPTELPDETGWLDNGILPPNI